MKEETRDVPADRRGQILQAALRVFSSKGFHLATNKDVAAAAGIQSAGLIYHYFKNKADLLSAVILEYAPPLQLLAHADELMTLPPEVVLTRVGMAYLKLVDNPDLGGFFKIVFGEALRNPAFARTFAEVGPLRILRFLTEYLQAQMDAGVLRPADPRIAARCFLGPLVLQILTRSVLQLPEVDRIDPKAIVDTTVRIFLGGLAQPADVAGERGGPQA